MAPSGPRDGERQEYEPTLILRGAGFHGRILRVQDAAAVRTQHPARIGSFPRLNSLVLEDEGSVSKSRGIQVELSAYEDHLTIGNIRACADAAFPVVLVRFRRCVIHDDPIVAILLLANGPTDGTRLVRDAPSRRAVFSAEQETATTTAGDILAHRDNLLARIVGTLDRECRGRRVGTRPACAERKYDHVVARVALPCTRPQQLWYSAVLRLIFNPFVERQSRLRVERIRF